MQRFFRPRTMCFDRLILWAYYMLPQNKLSQMLVKVSCSCLGKKIQQLEKKKKRNVPQHQISRAISLTLQPTLLLLSVFKGLCGDLGLIMTILPLHSLTLGAKFVCVEEEQNFRHNQENGINVPRKKETSDFILHYPYFVCVLVNI